MVKSGVIVFVSTQKLPSIQAPVRNETQSVTMTTFYIMMFVVPVAIIGFGFWLARKAKTG